MSKLKLEKIIRGWHLCGITLTTFHADSNNFFEVGWGLKKLWTKQNNYFLQSMKRNN